MTKSSAPVTKLRSTVVAVAGILYITFLACLVSIIATQYRLWPTVTVVKYFERALELPQHWRHDLGIEPTKFRAPVPTSLLAESRVDANRAYQGYTLLGRGTRDGFRLELLDMQNRKVYDWPLQMPAFFPGVNERVAEYTGWLADALLQKNGNVLINVSAGPIVMLDRCGEILWRAAGSSHHSLFIRENGDIVSPIAIKRHEKGESPFPLLVPPFLEEGLVTLAQDGKIKAVKSILDGIYAAEAFGVLTSNGAEPSGPFLYSEQASPQPTHINDVEVLSESFAEAFPLFEAGDVLVSSRNLNALLLYSSDLGRLKWWMVGPFHRQHDPDFLANGNIMLFDNRTDYKRNGKLKGSRVIEINPTTRNIVWSFESQENRFFYSATKGRQQPLDNGNILITASDTGHAFEVTRSGDVVWEYINRWDKAYAGFIPFAYRYAPSEVAFLSQTCKRPSDRSR